MAALDSEGTVDAPVADGLSGAKSLISSPGTTALVSIVMVGARGRLPAPGEGVFLSPSGGSVMSASASGRPRGRWVESNGVPRLSEPVAALSHARVAGGIERYGKALRRQCEERCGVHPIRLLPDMAKSNIAAEERVSGGEFRWWMQAVQVVRRGATRSSERSGETTGRKANRSGEYVR